jgi:hypothetical protein
VFCILKLLGARNYLSGDGGIIVETSIRPTLGFNQKRRKTIE